METVVKCVFKMIILTLDTLTYVSYRYVSLKHLWSKSVPVGVLKTRVLQAEVSLRVACIVEGCYYFLFI